jgi:hypothetical protein
MSLDVRQAADASAALLFGLCHAVLELMVVLGLVEMTQRLDNETVAAERPLLEAGDPNPFSGPARSGVRADEGPVELASRSTRGGSALV